MSEETRPAQQPSIESDANEFKRLLARRDQVFAETFSFPFYEEPLTVYYRLLKAGEEPTISLPDDFADLSPKEKFRINLEHLSNVVFAMIDKARSDAPAPYRLDRETWEAMKRDLPQAHGAIVGRISGITEQVSRSFFGGPPRPAPSSS